MKKIGLLVAVMFVSLCTLNAQSLNNKQNTIGIRATNGAEVSYQRFISSNNRIEINAGLGGYGIDLTGVYQWVNNLKMLEGGQFRWYAGVGANTGFWSKEDADLNTGVSLGVLGQIGTEFEFKKAPIVLSLDYRPTLYFIPSTVFSWGNLGLGIRFAF